MRARGASRRRAIDGTLADNRWFTGPGSLRHDQPIGGPRRCRSTAQRSRGAWPTISLAEGFQQEFNFVAAGQDRRRNRPLRRATDASGNDTSVFQQEVKAFNLNGLRLRPHRRGGSPKLSRTGWFPVGPFQLNNKAAIWPALRRRHRIRLSEGIHRTGSRPAPRGAWLAAPSGAGLQKTSPSRVDWPMSTSFRRSTERSQASTEGERRYRQMIEKRFRPWSVTSSKAHTKR
jgi:hypothetical protein